MLQPGWVSSMPSGWLLKVSFLQSIKGKVVLVFGAGVTGKSVARFLSENGANPILIDEKESDSLKSNMDQQRNLANVDLSAVTIGVISPGWRREHLLIQEALKAGIELISEIDLAWRVRSEVSPNQKWIALTGTNGKTTTVQMTEAMLQKCGIRARACGNVGDPVIDLVTDPGIDLLILELSSFQLAWSKEARFSTSAILNIADDHIDWHGSFAAYAEAKFRIGDMSEALIANFDDEEIRLRLGNVMTKLVTYTLDTPKPHQIGLVENLVVDRAFVSGDAEVLFELGDVKPAVPHNVANAIAAAALARSVGADSTSIASALREFKLDHHRLELILESDGVTWIDDSKATNPHAALAALRSQIKSIWIAGGLAKGAKMDQLVRDGASRIKFAILIGTDAPVIARALQELAPEIEFELLDPELKGMELMREAVRRAKERAVSGDTVLLAPACASMDQFTNYAERGDNFAAAVKELVNGQ